MENINIKNIESIINSELNLELLDENEKNEYIQLLTYILIVEYILKDKSFKYQGIEIKNIKPSCMLFEYKYFKFFQTVYFHLLDLKIFENKSFLPSNFEVTSDIYEISGNDLNQNKFNFDELEIDLSKINKLKIEYSKIIEGIFNFHLLEGKTVWISEKRHMYKLKLDKSIMKMYIESKGCKCYLDTDLLKQNLYVLE